MIKLRLERICLGSKLARKLYRNHLTMSGKTVFLFFVLGLLIVLRRNFRVPPSHRKRLVVTYRSLKLHGDETTKTLSGIPKPWPPEKLKTVCSLDDLQDQRIGRTPQWQLDRNKFLYPILTNGPNNQVIGLRDSIYLAMRLNRTLILPDFRKHKTDSSGALDVVPVEVRIDLSRLSTFVSVASSADLSQICRGKFDAVFLTDRSQSMYEFLPKAKLRNEAHLNISSDVAIFPRDVKDCILARDDDGNGRRIRLLYESNARCALYVYPFRSVDARESAAQIRNAQTALNTGSVDFSVRPGKTLYSLAFAATTRPKYVTHIAQTFSAKISAAKMIAVHWRFDVEDWMVRCGKQTAESNNTQVVDMCYKLQRINAVDIAEAILSFARELESRTYVKVDAVYFAAPLTLSTLANEVRRRVLSIDRSRLRLYIYADLKDHLRKFGDCEMIHDNREEVLSLVEMEIASKAFVFLRSPTSSWSNNVVRERITAKTNRHDANVLKLTWDAHAKINSNS